MKHLLAVLGFICISLSVVAQDVPFERSAFPGQRKELRVAKKQMKQGMKLAGKGEVDRKEALDLLLSAHAFNPNNARLNYTIGSVLFQSQDPHLSLPYLEKAYSLNQNVAPDIFFLLGRAYHLNHFFELALSFYQEYARVLDGKMKKRMLPLVELYSRQASFGDSLVKNPTAFFVDNMGDRVNSVWPEYAPVLLPDGHKLWFTSRRPGSTGGKIDKNEQYFEDVYYLEKIGGIWSEPINPGVPLNTEKHESSAGMNPDRKALILRRGNPSGDFWLIEGTPPQEMSLRKLSKRINSSDDETTLTFSPDSSRVWFVSTRKRGYGGKDIWMCQAKTRGGWRKAVNAGPAVNTPFDEESPFMYSDGKTLYFSSKGLPGMGGFDVFRTTFEGGVYSAPVNMGSPVNSASDDLFFSLEARGKNGYLASSRPGGSGFYDLYRVRIVDPDKPLLYQTDTFSLTLSMPGPTVPEPLPALKPYEPVILIRGITLDAANSAAVSALVTLSDQSNGQLAESMETSAAGSFLLNVPVKKRYLLTALARGYLPATETVDVSQMDSYASIQVPVRLTPMAIGAGTELRTTLFPPNDSQFSTSDTRELDLLVAFLKLNETTSVLIRGFATESEDAIQLPGARAAKVSDYLVSKGIFSGRITLEQYSISPETGVVEPTPDKSAIRIVITQI